MTNEIDVYVTRVERRDRVVVKKWEKCREWKERWNEFKPIRESFTNFLAFFRWVWEISQGYWHIWAGMQVDLYRRIFHDMRRVLNAKK